MKIHASIEISAAIIVIAISILGGFLLYKSKTEVLTDNKIRERFNCDRLTLDYRETDVYCKNPNLYRQHLKEHKVIGQ
jgi:hypothetical protein